MKKKSSIGPHSICVDAKMSRIHGSIEKLVNGSAFVRLLSLSLIFMLFSSTLGAEIRVSFNINKVHCLFDFIEAISGNPMKTRVLKEVFDKSTFCNKENLALLDEFNSIKNRSQDFRDSKMIIQSIQSNDLSAFEDNAKNLIEKDSQARFFEIVRNFEPVYDQLIWNDNFEKLNNCKEKFVTVFQKAKIGAVLAKISKFLCSSWPDSDLVQVFLYPIPGKNGSSRSLSLGKIQSVGIFVEEKGIAGKVGLISHEICHSLMRAQSPEAENAIFKYFAGSASKYWFWAYCRLGEILATSIGNGWIFEQVIGSQDQNEWYQDEYIDQLSHAIYPSIKEYLAEGKSFDNDLATKIVETFAKLFPNSLNSFENVFCDILLISDGQDFNTREIAHFFDQKFNVSCGIQRSSPIDHEKTISFAKQSNSSVLLVVHEKHIQEFEKFVAQFEVLRKYRDKLLTPGASYVFATLDENCKPFIIIKAQNLEMVSDYAGKIKEAKEFSPEAPFLVYH